MRSLLITILLLSFCVTFGCKSYNKALQDTVTAADETAGMSAMRSVAVAEQTYATSNNGSYGTFDQLVKAGYLDSRFNSDKPRFKGYLLSLSISDKNGEPSYSVNADPEPAQTGRHFYMDSTSGLIHVNPARAADVSDPSIG